MEISSKFFGLLLSVIMTISGSWRVDEVTPLMNEIEMLECQLVDTQLAVDSLQRENDSLNIYLGDPLRLAKEIYKSKKVFFKDAKSESNYAGTDIQISNGVKPQLSERMLAAIFDYDGPPFTVSSATRSWTRRSHHWDGNAIDIRLEDTSVADWLLTNTGRQWLQKHNIRYYIEDNHTRFLKNMFSEDYEPFFLINRKATGPHIHLEIYGKRPSGENISKSTT